MRIQTGRTVQAKLNVDVLYRCSSCGKRNLDTQTIVGEASTATVMGINLDQNIYSNARNDLQERIDAIIDPNDPHRFRYARFTCKCPHCKHAEPWARMNYDRLNLPMLICAILMLFFGLGTFPINIADYAAEPYGLILPIVFFSSAAIFISCIVYRIVNTRKMEKRIASLPKESLPILLPHSEKNRRFIL